MKNPKVNLINNSAHSLLFDDIFHSIDGAMEEAKLVFIQGNNLNNRWTLEDRDFTIGELGFGFGTSFIAAAKEWNASTKHSQLNFVSIEGFPIQRIDLENFYAAILKELNQNSFETEIIKELIRKFPPSLAGIHRINLEKFRISLTLIFHEVENAFESYDLLADAWFLDGFSPKKNPDMWSLDVFKNIYKNTAPGGTFTTYSVSAVVRNNSEASGFKIKIIPGFGSKKEMLTGSKMGISNAKNNRPKEIAIIGGGLAGLSLAYSLGQRNISAVLFEEANSLGQGASSNKSAVIMPLLSAAVDPLSTYYITGYLKTIDYLKDINSKIPIPSLRLDGAIRLANVKKWQSVVNNFEKLGLNLLGKILSADQIKELFGINQEKEGIFYFEGGSVQPIEIIRTIHEHFSKTTEFKLKSKISKILKTGEKFMLTDEQGFEYPFDAVIIANAHACSLFDFSKWVPIEKIKGQLFSIPNDTNYPTLPFCYDGYITPSPTSNEVLIGATYEHNKHETEFDISVCDNLLARMSNSLGIQIDPDFAKENAQGKVCFRTTSPDRLPVVGQMVDRQGENIDNLFISVGHGSRGMVSTFLAAEIITDLLTNSPLPIENETYKYIAPRRFLDRSSRKDKTVQELYPASFEWRQE